MYLFTNYFLSTYYAPGIVPNVEYNDELLSIRER